MAITALFAIACQSIPTHARADGVPGASSATAGAGYEVRHWTIDGGGGPSSGSSYKITGTIAQPDSEPLQPSTGATYAITGGLWPGLIRSDPAAPLFADGFEAP